MLDYFTIIAISALGMGISSIIMALFPYQFDKATPIAWGVTLVWIACFIIIMTMLILPLFIEHLGY